MYHQLRHQQSVTPQRTSTPPMTSLKRTSTPSRAEARNIREEERQAVARQFEAQKVAEAHRSRIQAARSTTRPGGERHTTTPASSRFHSRTNSLVVGGTSHNTSSVSHQSTRPTSSIVVPKRVPHEERDTCTSTTSRSSTPTTSGTAPRNTSTATALASSLSQAKRYAQQPPSTTKTQPPIQSTTHVKGSVVTIVPQGGGSRHAGTTGLGARILDFNADHKVAQMLRDHAECQQHLTQSTRRLIHRFTPDSAALLLRGGDAVRDPAPSLPLGVSHVLQLLCIMNSESGKFCSPTDGAAWVLRQVRLGHSMEGEIDPAWTEEGLTDAPVHVVPFVADMLQNLLTESMEDGKNTSWFLRTEVWSVSKVKTIATVLAGAFGLPPRSKWGGVQWTAFLLNVRQSGKKRSGHSLEHAPGGEGLLCLYDWVLAVLALLCAEGLEEEFDPNTKTCQEDAVVPPSVDPEAVQLLRELQTHLFRLMAS